MKTTIKLLLGATLVAGLSISAFAACANNVLMGDKQLKDVADGTDNKDAVNYAQTLAVTTVGSGGMLNIDANTTVHTWTRVDKVGRNICLHVLASTTTSGKVLFQTPEGFRPRASTVYGTFNGYNTDKGAIRVYWSSTGNVVMGNIPTAGWVTGSICYMN